MAGTPILSHPFDVMRAGYEVLLDVVAAHGFEAHEPRWEVPEYESGQGAGSALSAYGRGDNRVLGELARGDRVIELVLHHRLLPPTYRSGRVRIDHGALMRGDGAVAPAYPPSSSDPLAGFRAVAEDLRRHGGSFVGR